LTGQFAQDRDKSVDRHIERAVIVDGEIGLIRG
jgi:hypothetical protein